MIRLFLMWLLRLLRYPDLCKSDDDPEQGNGHQANLTSLQGYRNRRKYREIRLRAEGTTLSDLS